MPKCLACIRGFVEECEYGGCSSEVDSDMVGNVSDENDESRGINDDSGQEDDSISEVVRRERRNKPDHALRDQQSTGRKRAAKLYPLDRTAPCEWRGKDNMGGGIGIRGCNAGMQQARHHGPDYNTLNNDPTNVSRICHVCHNRWHAANDPAKGESYLRLYGHSPKKLGKAGATPDGSPSGE